jgi:hypothetical protein
MIAAETEQRFTWGLSLMRDQSHSAGGRDFESRSVT